MKRFLCWIGLHNWDTYSWPLGTYIGHGATKVVRLCVACDKQETYMVVD